jgi:hypothetical protein
MSVYADFSDGSQSITINRGESVSFNVDFFSMNPPMTIKAQLYQGGSLIYTFLNTNTNNRIYHTTYSYTPANSGTYEIKVIGTDKINTDSEFLTLIVNPVQPPTNNPPVITSNPITSINEGTIYNYDVDAYDNDGPSSLIYSLIQNPSWLSIDPNTGMISGTAPLVNGDTDYSVKVKVSDGKDFDTQTYILTVKDIPSQPNHAPKITSNPVTSVTEGNDYNYYVIAEDDDGDKLIYSLIDSPDWLHINPNTGHIEGTAPLVDSSTDYRVEIEVSDGRGGRDTQIYTLKVKNYVSGGAIETSRIINDDFYYQNKYYDQFETGKTVSTEKIISNNISLWILLYILLSVISLGIIIVFFLLIKKIRGRF